MHKDVLKSLVGGAVVYVAMAACSASGQSSTGPSANAGADASAFDGTEGAAGSSSGHDASADNSSGGAGGQELPDGSAGGFLDALTDPVPDANADVAVSGSRLKAIWMAGEDGSRQFEWRWRDTQRNEDCQFIRAGDGTQRCMPLYQVAWVNSYSDPNCTVPAALVSTGQCAAAGRYAATTESDGCVSRFSVRPIEGKLATQVYYISGQSQCIEVPLPEGLALHAMGQIIPPSSFVAANEQVDD